MRLQHHFLIATPSLHDSGFSDTVTYICDHSEEGALGFIINRETPLFISDVFEQLSVPNQSAFCSKMPVHLGGPVQPDKGFVLHQSRTNHWRASLTVADDIRITTSKDVLEDFAHDKLSHGKMLLLGYASWEADQLEKEIIEDNAWLVAPANLDIIFDVPVQERLQAAASLIGVDLRKMVPDVIGYA